MSWKEGVKVSPDDPKLVVSRSVSLPSQLSSLVFYFVLIKSMCLSVINFLLLGFVFLLNSVRCESLAHSKTDNYSTTSVSNYGLCVYMCEICFGMLFGVI